MAATWNHFQLKITYINFMQKISIKKDQKNLKYLQNLQIFSLLPSYIVNSLDSKSNNNLVFFRMIKEWFKFKPTLFMTDYNAHCFCYQTLSDSLIVALCLIGMSAVSTCPYTAQALQSIGFWRNASGDAVRLVGRYRVSLQKQGIRLQTAYAHEGVPLLNLRENWLQGKGLGLAVEKAFIRALESRISAALIRNASNQSIYVAKVIEVRSLIVFDLSGFCISGPCT